MNPKLLNRTVPFSWSLFFLVAAMRLAPGQAATLVGDYRFESSLKSSVAGAPDVVVEGVSHAAFVATNVLGNNRPVIELAAGGGLQINTSGLLDPEHYTLVLFAELNSVSGYNRPIDVKDPPDDQGWFILNGSMIFLPAKGDEPSVVNAGQFVQLTLVKDGAKVRAYAEKAQQFDLTDAGNQGRIGDSGVIHILGQATGSYAPGGRVARIRLFNGALTDADVSALAPLVPTTKPSPSGTAIELSSGFDAQFSYS